VGILISVLLIVEMGLLAVGFTGGIVVLGVLWYVYYAQDRVVREGAIYHLFARLGRFRHDALDRELQDILEEKDIGDASAYDKLVARASVLRLSDSVSYDEIVGRAAAVLSERSGHSPDALRHGFLEGSRYSSTSVSNGAALAYAQVDGLSRQQLVLAHCQTGTSVLFENGTASMEGAPIYALFFLLSPKDDEGRHLTTLAAIANRVNEDQFLLEWRSATDEQEIKESLLHHDRYLTLHLLTNTGTEALIDKRIDALTLPTDLLVALIRRDGELLVPSGRTALREGDRLTIIGQPPGIERLRELYDVGTASRRAVQ
jgi:mannitol/fructose-specific phosphotransferase system IIA component (Ntr-type)